MKNILLFSSLFFAGMLSAQQQISVDQYDQLKSSGQLDGQTKYIIVTPDKKVQATAPSRYSGPVQTQSTVCNCMIPLDTTFSVVPFQFGTPPDYRNDDASSVIINLPFTFNFYGVSYTSLYINNNGNISFGSPYGAFSSTGFPDINFNMIAPFWSDVDTRDSASGLVYFQITPTHLIVKWDSVGYYSMHTDKLNTFQLIITDGLDTILPAGSNVSFCYGDMQWTTGDASSGINGFGGTPSTTGVNIGNGVDYFQVTRNDQAGNIFDGPYGLNDGIDWLDDQEIYFNTSITGNIPPLVMNSTICDTIDVFTGDTLRSINQDSILFTFYFMTPEINQTVTPTLSTNAPASAFSYTLVTNDANYKEYACVFRAKHIGPGIYTVTGSAIDDGFPVEQSSGTVVIHTYFDPALFTTDPATVSSLTVYPNPANDQIVIGNIPEGNSTLIITDILGQVVFSNNSVAQNTTVNTSEFIPGVYFISLVNENGDRQTVKFIRR